MLPVFVIACFFFILIQKFGNGAKIGYIFEEIFSLCFKWSKEAMTSMANDSFSPIPTQREQLPEENI